MAAVDFSAMDLAGIAEVISAARDEVTARCLRSREERQAEERSHRALLSHSLRALSEGEDRLRQAAGTALPRTDLPAPDEPLAPRRPLGGDPMRPHDGRGLPPGRPHP